jgi:hypothetical protein
VTTQLARLKKEFPTVRSIYQPSGRIAAEGHGSLMFGSVVGGVICLLVVVLFNVVLGAVIKVVVAGWPSRWWLLPPAGLFVLAVTLVVPWALGLAAGKLIAEMGKSGKNRNPSLAFHYSISATAVGCLLGFLIYLLSSFHSPILWPECLCFGVFVVIALVVSWGVTDHAVKTTKFCEVCEVYMVGKKLRPVCLGGLRQFLYALQQRDMMAAATAAGAARGRSGRPQLFWCPFCGRGYLDLYAGFVGTWNDGHGRKHRSEASWLTASVALSADEIRLFSP